PCSSPAARDPDEVAPAPRSRFPRRSGRPVSATPAWLIMRSPGIPLPNLWGVFMPVEVFAVAMVVAVGLLVGRLVANRTGLPEAAVYVVVGVVAGLLPGVSQVRLSPDL